MKDMRAKDLVLAYSLSLDRQIVGQGSSLACRDEDLWRQVEGPLRDGDPRETHCLGLDPLRVLEDSLTAAAACTDRVGSRGGLRGLERAFQVLEQAALNLHLCPWREEFKVVKMYSGTFTHDIRPVLSMPQIERLFGLLGYQLSSPRHEQLRLLPHRVSPASPDDLLRLSCAFFLARCECRLLLTALGEHAGEVQWELSVVRERVSGNGLQGAMDATRKLLTVEHAGGEGDVDLYTDVQENGHERKMAVSEAESPPSLSWASQSDAAQSNGITPSPLCVSTLNCQVTNTPGAEPHITRSSSSSVKQRRRQSEACGALQEEECACLQGAQVCYQLCRDCHGLHDLGCPALQPCKTQNHRLVFPDTLLTEMKKSRAVPPPPNDDSFRVSSSPSLSSSAAAMSTLALHDALTAPISYHDCCDLAQLDPQVLCRSCSVLHAASCRGITFCQSEEHDMQPLGVCSCGSKASRDPLVLCRFCGKEYCRDCWYQDPFQCTCGQRFDQSSSV